MRRTKRLFKARSVKAGLPPGTLVHIGETPRDATGVTLIRYNEANFEEHQHEQIHDQALTPSPDDVLWLNVEGVHDIETVRSLGEAFNLHPLVLEDIVNTVQRPKVEDFGNYLFIVIKMLFPHDESSFASEQLSLILGPNYLLTFQEGIQGDAFGVIRERLRHGKGKLRAMGSDYLAYALMDAIVDNYFSVLESFGERLLLVEEEVALHPHPRVLIQLNDLKKEIIYLRKAVWPLREVLSFLERGDSSLISDATRLYLRDVYDHTIQALDTVETYRDLLAGMLDLYLSSISNRTNEIMKFLTVIGTIFMPLTFIVGLYGMNFKHMPELEWQYGYYTVLVLMLLITLGMVVYFRHKRWL